MTILFKYSDRLYSLFNQQISIDNQKVNQSQLSQGTIVKIPDVIFTEL